MGAELPRRPRLGKDPSRRACLQVVDKVLAVQPQIFIRTSADQFCLLVDACFKVKQKSVVTSLASTLQTVYKAFPPDEADSPAKVTLRTPLRQIAGAVEDWPEGECDAAQVIHEKVQASVVEHLQSAGTTANPLSPSAPLPGVCTAICVILALEEVAPGTTAAYFLGHSARLLGRIARENSQNAGLFLAAKTPVMQRGMQRSGAEASRCVDDRQWRLLRGGRAGAGTHRRSQTTEPWRGR